MERAPLDDAERVAAFVVEASTRAHGARAFQGPWKPMLPAAEGDALRAFATRRLLHFPESAARALVGWSLGTRDAVVLRHVPAALEIVRHQAEGRRCVSILDDDVPTAPHADALAFAIHDLCHLEKFFDEEHHRGEVGFSRAVLRYASSDEGARLDASLDDVWIRDRDAVIGDMNGSAVFLFAALKMRLKMATRRRVARERGTPPVVLAPLDDDESRAFDADRSRFFDALGFPEDVARAGERVSARRDAAADAVTLLRHFEGLAADLRWRTAS
ncbi:MAG: hypothetical protein U0169_20400 [Polyangiaceae bacterium]